MMLISQAGLGSQKSELETARLGIALDESVEARLVDRYFAAVELLDLYNPDDGTVLSNTLFETERRIFGRVTPP